GMPIECICLGVGGSRQILRETSNLFAYQGQIGWFDNSQCHDWTPSNPNGNAARLRRMIETIAPNAPGDTRPLKILGVFWPQMEGDAFSAAGRELADDTLHTFVDWIRDTIVEAGLSAYPPDVKIPFVIPKITREPWETGGQAYG